MQYVKGFLNHGDSFSLQEAIHYGVPVVVLPLKLEEFNVSVYLIFLLIILNHIYPAEAHLLGNLANIVRNPGRIYRVFRSE